MKHKHIRIGEAAKLLGLSVEQVRYRATTGQLPCHTKPNGHRLFDPADLTNLPLGHAVLKLDVDTTGLESGLQRATRIVKDFALEVEAVFARIRQIEARK